MSCTDSGPFIHTVHLYLDTFMIDAGIYGTEHCSFMDSTVAHALSQRMRTAKGSLDNLLINSLHPKCAVDE